jgi:hypothetical protein
MVALSDLTGGISTGLCLQKHSREGCTEFGYMHLKHRVVFEIPLAALDLHRPLSPEAENLLKMTVGGVQKVAYPEQGRLCADRLGQVQKNPASARCINGEHR